MSEATLTFEVDESLKSEFATAAIAHDRSSTQMLRDFMRDVVREQQDVAAYDAWFRQQVGIGEQSADAGDLIPADEGEAQFAARRDATRHRLA